MWIEKNGLLIRIPKSNEPQFIFYSIVACFGWFNTILKPDYLKNNNWELLNDKIIKKFSILNENKHSIIIFSNLNKIIKGNLTIEEIKIKFDTINNLFIDKKIPILALFSLKNNNCSKPHTGMWRIVKSFYLNNRFDPPNIKKCFFVGGNAGRKKPWKTSFKEVIKADKNYIDRAFAYNLQLKFYDPNKYFLNDKTNRKWEYFRNILNQQEKISIKENYNIDNNLDPFKDSVYNFLKENFINTNQFLIIIVGSPSSSKTTISNYIKKNTIEQVDDKKINSWIILDTKSFSKTYNASIKKCIGKINEELIYGNSVIVDGTNETKEIRSLYIDIAKKYTNIGILIIKSDISTKIAKHLNHMKIEISPNYNLEPTSSYIFSNYIKYFEEPEMNEFENIINICKIIKYPFLLADIKEWWYIYDK